MSGIARRVYRHETVALDTGLLIETTVSRLDDGDPSADGKVIDICTSTCRGAHLAIDAAVRAAARARNARAGLPINQPVRRPDRQPAAGILERLGGVKAVAAALRIPRGTVHGWRVKGRIPVGRQLEILTFASSINVPLGAHEFDA